MSKADIKTVAIVMIGIFAAGYLMNAMRSNTWVQGAIAGYDA